MTEQHEGNRSHLAEVFAMAANHPGGPEMFAEPEHQSDLAVVLGDIFAETVGALPEDMSGEQADTWISEHILDLLDQAFKAGMIYYANFVEPPPAPSEVAPANGGNRIADGNSDSVLTITAGEAAEIVTGLLGNGVILRVERRKNQNERNQV